MGLVGDPIPPRPAAFTPEGAPPGVAVDFTALKDEAGRPWHLGRPVIEPRLTLVHTNGASVEASLQSSINHGNRAPANTKPHYCVNRPQPTKLVPSNRRAIANATVDAYQGSYGDVSMFSIAIETADAGWPTPGDAGGFLADHAEIVARILAYESIVWDIPLEYPSAWHGAGTACHTEPFEYPFWTLYRGKACPGREKKRQVREEILPRAREIRAAWLAPEEEDMDLSKSILWRPKGFQNIFIITPAGSVLHASAALLAAMKIPTTNIVEDDHKQTLVSMLAQAGLTASDLVKAV